MIRLLAALDGRDTILVLDNCEHLVAAVAALAESLLTAGPRLRVLATSREPLGVPGEVLHPVDALAEADAVQLFADRAAAVRPTFVLDAATRPAVTEICRRLDGQPLPIELAAARLRTLSPAEIAARLDDRFRLLTAGARTALPRHQTLRAVVDWSWDLLSEPERAVARRLGGFAGGATLAAAERVCGPEAWDALTSLVDKSLVVAVPQADGPTRYRMLETIRAYAGEKLEAAGERAAAEAAHAAFVLDLVEEAEPHIRGRDQLDWLARLRAEADEIDLALRRTVTADLPIAYRIVVGMTWSWLVRGRLDESRRWLAALPPPGHDVEPDVVALALAYRAVAAVGGGDPAGGREHAEAAIAALATLPRPWHPVLQLVEPVTLLFAKQDEGPLRRLETAADDPWTRALALQTRALRAENDGDLAAQRELVRATHTAFTVLGERFGLGMVLYSLGELEGLAGEHDAAAAAFDEAIALTAELGNDDDLHQFLAGRAMVDARRGDYAAARALLARAVEPRRQDGSLAAAKAQVERMAGDLDAARAHLAVVDAAIEADPAAFAIPQRRAYVDMLRAQVELAAGAPAKARVLLRSAAEAAVTSRDSPVVSVVAEVAAQLAHAEGDDDAAVGLLAAAAARRGTLDRGAPEVVALLAALGPDADARIAAATRRNTAADTGGDASPRTAADADGILTAFLARDPSADGRAGRPTPHPYGGRRSPARRALARGVVTPLHRRQECHPAGTQRPQCTRRSCLHRPAARQVRRRYRYTANGANTAITTADEISANVSGAATGPPVSSPRAASATCVTGLISTNPRSHDGRVFAGTKTLLPNVSGNITSAPSPCTDRGCPTTIASAVNTQHKANANTMTSANVATTASDDVVIRKPSTSPITIMITPEVRYRTRSARIAPTSGALRAIGRLRKRSKMPVCRSSASPTPVPADANTIVCTSTPGSASCRYASGLPEIAPPNT